MADIEVKCEQCGAPITLSEYAAMETISCRGCGAPLRARASSPSDSVRERLRLKKSEPPPPPPPEQGRKAKAKAKKAPQEQESEDETWRFTQYVEQSRETIKVDTSQKGVVWSWLLFVVLASAMAAIRFLDVLPETYLDMLKNYGPYAALVMHIILILVAFKDTVFQGILCLLIPGYSVYYLFLVSDNFWLRAVFGGILAGIGFDSAIFYRDVAADTYRAVSDYIASGG